MAPHFPHDLTHIDTWVFDLDNTLYRADVEFFSQIDKKMTAYISRYLALETEEAGHVRKQYWAEYGTTLSGLMAVHGMDPAEFLDYVHDVDLTMLKPDPALRAAIKALRGRKLIFTNGSKGHAHNVGTHLGLYDLFDGSFGIEDGDYIPKPKVEPYHEFCKIFDVNPHTAIMFEDSVRNLEVPKTLGMATVLVTSNADWKDAPEITRPAGDTTRADWVDYITDNLAAWLTGTRRGEGVNP